MYYIYHNLYVHIPCFVKCDFFITENTGPIPLNSEYLEVKFSVYSTEEFTDRGFYAKYDVRKASNTLNTSHEFNKEVTTHARISSVLTGIVFFFK